MSLLLGPARDHRRPVRPERAGLSAYTVEAWHERDLMAAARCVQGAFLTLATGVLLWALLGALAYGAFMLIGS